jgi:hypothetical protein
MAIDATSMSVAKAFFAALGAAATVSILGPASVAEAAASMASQAAHHRSIPMHYVTRHAACGVYACSCVSSQLTYHDVRLQELWGRPCSTAAQLVLFTSIISVVLVLVSAVWHSASDDSSSSSSREGPGELEEEPYLTYSSSRFFTSEQQCLVLMKNSMKCMGACMHGSCKAAPLPLLWQQGYLHFRASLASTPQLRPFEACWQSI